MKRSSTDAQSPQKCKKNKNKPGDDPRLLINILGKQPRPRAATLEIETMTTQMQQLESMRTIRTEIVETNECWIFDMINNPGHAVVIWPEDLDAVRTLEIIPVGSCPVKTDDGFTVCHHDGVFGAGRVSSCFRTRDIRADGTASQPSNWKLG